ncbi:hypothetical protein VTK73DRAFT_3458 [Phialemonium thermophilum]|uniref:Uncharacterized protein n=1 Tax=Phialemonium thermophilum TaxID=223376 RepID=A0ABR3VIA1_9PEZI
MQSVSQSLQLLIWPAQETSTQKTRWPPPWCNCRHIGRQRGPVGTPTAPVQGCGSHAMSTQVGRLGRRAAGWTREPTTRTLGSRSFSVDCTRARHPVGQSTRACIPANKRVERERGPRRPGDSLRPSVGACYDKKSAGSCAPSRDRREERSIAGRTNL